MATNVNEPWADCDMLSEPKHKEEELIECKSYQIQEPNPINLYELYNNIVEFSDLKGKTLNAVVVFSDELIVFMTDDYTYIMAHEQDCCESVTIDDVCGDLADIIGDPITVAEELHSDKILPAKSEWDESFTWTFYKLATRSGYVDIKWYGTSNGYYSERVYLYKVDVKERPDITNYIVDRLKKEQKK